MPNIPAREPAASAVQTTPPQFRTPSAAQCRDAVNAMAAEVESFAWIGAVVRAIAGLAAERDPLDFCGIKTLANLAAYLADDRGNALDSARAELVEATGGEQ